MNTQPRIADIPPAPYRRHPAGRTAGILAGSLLSILLIPSCRKSDQAQRLVVEQDKAIRHSVKQKTEYVEHMIAKIGNLMAEALYRDHNAAVASVTKPDGTINVASLKGLEKRRDEDLAAIRAAIRVAREKWAGTLVDDQNALAFNAQLQAWFKAEIDALAVMNQNTDRIFAIIDRVFNGPPSPQSPSSPPG